MTEEITCDVLIMGAGPAGLSAGIYAARGGQKTIILAGKKPSALQTAHDVKNYPGFERITGPDLLAKMRAHALAAGAKIIDEDAIAVMLQGFRMVTTREKLITAGAVIIATGREQKKVLIPGEEKHIGRGVSYCALCDGPLYRQRKVILYGNDEESVDDAATLAEMGCKVTLMFPERVGELEAEVRESLSSAKFNVVENSKVKKILTDDSGLVRAVVAAPPDKPDEETEVETDALFIMSHVASNVLLKNAGLEMDEKGHIKVDEKQATNLEGVFAAGDITGGLLQIVTAVYEGAQAAVEAAKFARQQKSSS
ncbi:MAG: NAD(P)/FAD-dependent oxidoreductase [Promethearchaeota archaeon]